VLLQTLDYAISSQAHRRHQDEIHIVTLPAEQRLDGNMVNNINPDLTSGLDITRAMVQRENEGVSFWASRQRSPTM
jgi:hypothetical protein